MVIALDEAYVIPGTVTLASLATTGGLGDTGIPVWILYAELSRPLLDILRRTGDALGLRLEFARVALPADELPSVAHISKTTYLRFDLSDVLPGGRTVYLDTDLVVLQDIRPLFETELMTRPLGAVRSLWNPVLGRGMGLPGYEQLGLPPGRDYFNAGVLLVDVQRWGELDIGRRAHRFLVQHPGHAAWADQCALNWAVDDRWVRLPAGWNAFPMSAVDRAWYEHDDIVSFEQTLQIEQSASILHFAGALKPWAEDYPRCRARDIYRRYVEVAAAGRSRGATARGAVRFPTPE